MPAGRNPCQALADVTSEFNRFASTFLTNDDVCPESRRLKVMKSTINSGLLKLESRMTFIRLNSQKLLLIIVNYGVVPT